ncbi:hypothetical protein GLU01_01300 [Nanohaloarchaea archaeon]|nr:hypothetical protein [Candidatus Nanohaloarchaea archaeon]
MKGISQVLVVIVTAIVLMTTALSVILLVQSGSESAVGGLERTACTQSVRSQCAPAEVESINTPESCFDSDGSIPEALRTNIGNLPSVSSAPGSGDTSISCTTSDPFGS